MNEEEAKPTSVDKIRAAEADVQELQDHLDDIQNALSKAEQVATAAEEARDRSQDSLLLTPTVSS